MGTKTITDKDEIVRIVSGRLKKDSFIDLSQFVYDNSPETHHVHSFVRDIAYKLKRTGDFDIIEQENGNRLCIIPTRHKTWGERNPLLREFRTGFIATLFSILAGMVLFQYRYKEQSQQLKNLSDSVKNLTVEIKDLKGKK